MPRIPTAAILLTVACAILAAPCVGGESPAPGDPAPPLSADTLRRTHVDLEDLQGKIVLLQFWASWCATCVDEMPELRALYEAHAEDGFEIVGVSLDENPRDARRTIAEFGLPWPQICDGLGKQSPVARSYDVKGTPRYVLIDRDGLVSAPFVRPSELPAAVRALLESGLESPTTP